VSHSLVVVVLLFDRNQLTDDLDCCQSQYTDRPSTDLDCCQSPA